jgi:hypothetical protein
MSIFDFMFPDQAAASHLRRMADRQARTDRLNLMRQNEQSMLEERINELDCDVGVLALVLASLLETANEKGTISREEIKEKIEELDILDGFRDGKLNASFLRKWGK